MLDMGFIDDINYILQSSSEESPDGLVLATMASGNCPT